MEDLEVVVKVYTQRVGIRLGLIKVVHAGKVPPAFVSTDLDHSSTNHNTE